MIHRPDGGGLDGYERPQPAAPDPVQEHTLAALQDAGASPLSPAVPVEQGGDALTALSGPQPGDGAYSEGHKADDIAPVGDSDGLGQRGLGLVDSTSSWWSANQAARGLDVSASASPARGSDRLHTGAIQPDSDGVYDLLGGGSGQTRWSDNDVPVRAPDQRQTTTETAPTGPDADEKVFTDPAAGSGGDSSATVNRETSADGLPTVDVKAVAGSDGPGDGEPPLGSSVGTEEPTAAGATVTNPWAAHAQAPPGRSDGQAADAASRRSDVEDFVQGIEQHLADTGRPAASTPDAPDSGDTAGVADEAVSLPADRADPLEPADPASPESSVPINPEEAPAPPAPGSPEGQTADAARSPKDVVVGIARHIGPWLVSMAPLRRGAPDASGSSEAPDGVGPESNDSRDGPEEPNPDWVLSAVEVQEVDPSTTTIDNQGLPEGERDESVHLLSSVGGLLSSVWENLGTQYQKSIVKLADRTIERLRIVDGTDSYPERVDIIRVSENDDPAYKYYVAAGLTGSRTPNSVFAPRIFSRPGNTRALRATQIRGGVEADQARASYGAAGPREFARVVHSYLQAGALKHEILREEIQRTILGRNSPDRIEALLSRLREADAQAFRARVRRAMASPMRPRI